MYVKCIWSLRTSGCVAISALFLFAGICRSDEKSIDRCRVVFDRLCSDEKSQDVKFTFRMLRNGDLVDNRLKTLNEDVLPAIFEMLCLNSGKDKHIKLRIGDVDPGVSAIKLQEMLFTLLKHAPKDYQITIYVDIERVDRKKPNAKQKNAVEGNEWNKRK